MTRPTYDELVKALRDNLPLLEKIEDRMVIGDEGCIFSVEIVRDLVERASEPEPKPTNTPRELARRFIERAEALGYKGKKRDDAALDFFCGAAIGTELAGNKAASDHIGRCAVMLVSVRGFFGVKELAAAPEPKVESAEPATSTANA